LVLAALAVQILFPAVQDLPLLPLAASSLPIAIGIAVLRYRLYDIDLIINKALVYGGLAAVISAVYVLVVINIGALIGGSQRLVLASASPPSLEPATPVAMQNGTLPQMPRDTVVPVSHQGELLGALAVNKKRGENLNSVEQKLIIDLAGQAGLVLKNVGLNRELLARLDDLRASRQRLVTAQDEGRRRIERNLHDGAQQHLIALKMKVGLALAQPESKTRAILEQLRHDADAAIDNLRELARGIYPPLLASEGLGAALRGQARRCTVPVEL